MELESDLFLEAAQHSQGDDCVLVLIFSSCLRRSLLG